MSRPANLMDNNYMSGMSLTLERTAIYVEACPALTLLGVRIVAGEWARHDDIETLAIIGKNSKAGINISFKCNAVLSGVCPAWQLTFDRPVSVDQINVNINIKKGASLDLRELELLSVEDK
jgi:hypothetical protein